MSEGVSTVQAALQQVRELGVSVRHVQRLLAVAHERVAIFEGVDDVSEGAEALVDELGLVNPILIVFVIDLFTAGQVCEGEGAHLELLLGPGGRPVVHTAVDVHFVFRVELHLEHGVATAA